MDHIVLRVDMPDAKSEVVQRVTVHRLMEDFAEAGGTTVSLGDDAAAIFDGVAGLGRLVSSHNLSWMYDGNLAGTPRSLARTVSSIAHLDRPPVAITVNGFMTSESMTAAQEAAGRIPILGTTLPVDMGPKEAYKDFAIDWERDRVEAMGEKIEDVGKATQRRIALALGRKLGRAGVGGLVVAPNNLVALAANPVTASMLKLVHSTRSPRAIDLEPVGSMTPETAIAKGADWLLFGAQIVRASWMKDELNQLRQDVTNGLHGRQLG